MESKKKDLVEYIEQLESELESKADVKISVSVDYAFMNFKEFKSKDSDSQEYTFNEIQSCLRTLLTEYNSLAAQCEKHELYKAAIQAKVKKVTYGFDATNSINDQIGR
jgi:hypothetical protein